MAQRRLEVFGAAFSKSVKRQYKWGVYERGCAKVETGNFKR